MTRVLKYALPILIILGFIAYSVYVVFSFRNGLLTQYNGFFVFNFKYYFTSIGRNFSSILTAFVVEIPTFDFSGIVEGLTSLLNMLILVVNLGLSPFRGFLGLSIAALSVFALPMEPGFFLFDFLNMLMSVQIPYIQ